MKIGLIGAGRLGLCLALLIEDAGYDVLASDVRPDYVKDLNDKKAKSSEPDVQQYLEKASKIQFTTDNIRVISECDIIFTLVATPSLDDGSYDVSAVWKVVDDFKTASKDVEVFNKSLVIGCTTNPGDCDEIREHLNVDPDTFECPHEIDLNRKALTRHLTFSQGHRTCPGNGISRLEQNIAWNCLMDRIEKFDYTSETKIEYQPGIMLGTLELLLNFKRK